MKKADMHVHSHCSAHPSEWFLQRLGTRESYTTPQDVYAQAKARGMDFVALTDHNQIEGALELQRHYPQDVIVGDEITTYFPDNGCKVHVLVWGLTISHYRSIEEIRSDIFALRDFLKQQQLAHAVAHATFSINKRMDIEHFEKLVLLFDYFEAINGSRTRAGNQILLDYLQELTPQLIEELYTRHNIEPFSDTPWHKGLSGGSDDHSGLFIGKTYTVLDEDVSSPEEFLRCFREKKTRAEGRHNDYKGFAFSLYKIAYEFSHSRNQALSSTMLSQLTRLVFDGKSGTLKGKLALHKLKISTKPEKRDFATALSALISELEGSRGLDIEEKVERVYDTVASVSDAFMKLCIKGLKKSFGKGDMAGVLRNIAGLLPSLFITIPFFTTINVLTESRELLEHLKRRSGGAGWPQKRRYLWFTDTINDLNGVSETIQKLGWLTSQRGIDLTIVTCLLPEEDLSALPPNVLNLPSMATYTASFFDTYTLRIPSLLSSLKLLSEHEMDEIIISTPGPVGLLGQLCARLFHVPCSGIFHTDFSLYARTVLNDEGVAGFTEDYLRWFYSQCSTIRVPTLEYIAILEQRGYDRRRMVRFRRGIEKNLFRPLPREHSLMQQRYGIPEGINLLYAGRISKEKNISQLIRLYTQISSEFENVNLILCGNGPDYEEYQHQLKRLPRVFMLGRLPREQLPELYAQADLFLFPSTTDTFGMVVLEAQACGLPAIVSDKGGPHEIIIDGQTGHVARSDDDEDWLLKLRAALTTLIQFPERHLEMRHATREHVVANFDWNTVLNDLFGQRHHLGSPLKMEHQPTTPHPEPA